eukprot:COSAG01_NODE_774_length_13702_cov_11.108726_10_plen_48_part_00
MAAAGGVPAGLIQLLQACVEAAEPPSDGGGDNRNYEAVARAETEARE